MLRDFGSFLHALWRQWRVLLTGGSLFASLTLWGLTGHKSPSSRVNWLIFGITLIGAAFLSWREEWVATGRGLVEIDFSELDRATRGYTQAQSKQIFDRYKGKRWQGIVELKDFHYSDLAYSQAFIFMKYGGAMVHTVFLRWNPHLRSLALLPKGTRLKINGRIAAVDASSLRLTSCRVIEVLHTALALSDPEHPTSDPKFRRPSQAWRGDL